MIGSPVQWTDAAADALVERTPDPAVAARTLVALIEAARSAERAVALIDRAAVAVASIKHPVPRAIAAISVVRAAAGHVQAAQKIVDGAEPGLREHLVQVLAVAVAKREDGVRALAIAGRLADPRRRERAAILVAVELARQSQVVTATDPGVLLAAGRVDDALATGAASTDLAVALAARGDFTRAVDVIARIQGRRRRYHARRAAVAAALPVPGAVQLAARLPSWERDLCLIELATRAERTEDAQAITADVDRRTDVLRAIAVATARRGSAAEASRFVADLPSDAGTTVRLAEAVARQGDRDTAVALLAGCAPDGRAAAEQVCAVAASGDLAGALAAANTLRAWEKPAVLRKAAVAAARHGHPRTALGLAQGRQKYRVLGETAARGDLQKALTLLDDHIPPDEQLTALVVLGRALVRVGRLPATGLLGRAEALPGNGSALAELAAVEGDVGRAIAAANDDNRDHVACAAAAQGRLDDVLPLVEPTHALVLAAAVGGQLTAALAMATTIATAQANGQFGHAVVVHRRDIVVNVCQALAAAGQVDRAVDAAKSVPLRYVNALLRRTARTAAAYGHLDAARHTWWLAGGFERRDVVDAAGFDLDTAFAFAETVADDPYRSRDRAFADLAAVAADRGDVPVAAAALARIEAERWYVGTAWCRVAAAVGADRVHAAASAYLDAKVARWPDSPTP